MNWLSGLVGGVNVEVIGVGVPWWKIFPACAGLNVKTDRASTAIKHNSLQHRFEFLMHLDIVSEDWDDYLGGFRITTPNEEYHITTACISDTIGFHALLTAAIEHTGIYACASMNLM